MSVKIRLRRMGAKKRPFYRLVVADARSPRDGRFIEAVGTYDPLSDPATVTINAERVKDWLSKGARPTDMARQLLINEGLLERTGPVYEKRTDGARLSKKAQAKAAQAAEASAKAVESPEAPAEDPPAASEAPPPAEPVESVEPEASLAEPNEPAEAPAAPTEPAEPTAEPEAPAAGKSVAPDADPASPAGEAAPEANPPAPGQHAEKPAEGASE